MSSFIADPGTSWKAGEEPLIAKQLNALADELHQNVYGISGERTAAHSVAVGGGSSDPHVLKQAGDIGVGSSLRSSAAAVTNAQLAAVGLWRPYDLTGQDEAEVNHVQLLPSWGGPSVTGETPPKGAKPPSGGSGILGTVEETATNFVPGLGGFAAGAKAVGVKNPVSTVAGEVTSKLASLLEQAFGAVFVKAMLYVVLAGGGAALLIMGISRSAGLHPVEGARKVADVAAVGAAV